MNSKPAPQLEWLRAPRGVYHSKGMAYTIHRKHPRSWYVYTDRLMVCLGSFTTLATAKAQAQEHYDQHHS